MMAGCVSNSHEIPATLKVSAEVKMPRASHQSMRNEEALQMSRHKPLSWGWACPFSLCVVFWVSWVHQQHTQKSSTRGVWPWRQWALGESDMCEHVLGTFPGINTDQLSSWRPKTAPNAPNLISSEVWDKAGNTVCVAVKSSQSKVRTRIVAQTCWCVHVILRAV